VEIGKAHGQQLSARVAVRLKGRLVDAPDSPVEAQANDRIVERVEQGKIGRMLTFSLQASGFRGMPSGACWPGRDVTFTHAASRGKTGPPVLINIILHLYKKLY
jgi:hypothetical protein